MGAQIDETKDFKVVKTMADSLAVQLQKLVDEGFDEVASYHQGGRDWLIIGRR